MLLRATGTGPTLRPLTARFATGDAGEIDGDGRLSIQGRLDDLVISGGENIWPAQVEAVLRRHSSVLDVAVGGRPDSVWGVRLVAYVVPSPASQGVEPAAILADLRELVKEHLAARLPLRATHRRGPGCRGSRHRQGQPSRAADARRPSRPCRVRSSNSPAVRDVTIPKRSAHGLRP